MRATKRKKDGKIHHYWSVVENVRVGRRLFQRRALYLGELNDSQHAEWQRAVEAIDENGRVTQLKLFPEKRGKDRFVPPLHSSRMRGTEMSSKSLDAKGEPKWEKYLPFAMRKTLDDENRRISRDGAE